MSAPTHTPERVLFQELTKALVQTLGEKKGERLLSCLSANLSARQAYAEAVPIRPAPDYPQRREATRAAVEAFRDDLPTFIAAIPR